MRWAAALAAALVLVASVSSCTFLVPFVDKPRADASVADAALNESTDAGMIDEQSGEMAGDSWNSAANDGAAEPAPSGDDGEGGRVDASRSSDACVGQVDGARWGPKATDRCCQETPRSFDSYSDTDNCGVCGVKCGPGQECARSLFGYFFCVGCFHDGTEHNNECPMSGCCSTDHDGPEVFSQPSLQRRGVCTASNCQAQCAMSCPPPSVCYPSTTTSYVCVYPD